ncbi:porin [Ignatzschineria sp. LJL83]
MKKLLGIFSALSVFLGLNAGMTMAAPVQEITIKTELAYPVVLSSGISQPNFLRVSLKGFELAEAEQRVPLNLVLVVDRSGSMHGERIEKAREAAIMAVNIMDERDTLSIVAYDSGVEVVIPATLVKDKKAMIQKINNRLQPQGMTALFAGLSKGIEEVSRNIDPNKVNRIILLSDGQANTGPSSVPELVELTKLATQKNISVSTLGIGHDYNENLMAAIANYSDGNHAYIAEIQDLEKAMDREFRDSMSVVAQNFTITIELPEDVKPIRLLGRDGEIKGREVTVNMNQIYANQEKYVLLEIEPMTGNAGDDKIVANVHTQYLDIFTQTLKDKNEDIRLQFTADDQIALQSLNQDVIVKALTQEIVARQKEAVDYLEAGNYDAANRSLELANLSDAGSRIGLKGSEDLGNNNPVIYDSAYGFVQENSSPARMAILGMTGDWGTFTAGKQDNPFHQSLEELAELESSTEDLQKIMMNSSAQNSTEMNQVRKEVIQNIHEQKTQNKTQNKASSKDLEPSEDKDEDKDKDLDTSEDEKEEEEVLIIEDKHRYHHY